MSCNYMLEVEKDLDDLNHEQIERVKKIICRTLCNGNCKNEYLLHMTNIEYKNREYCRSTNCGVMVLLDNNNLSPEIIKCAKIPCNKCEAYKFHKYLQEKNYKIIKKLYDE